jgi:multidrug efflux pump subunit AcrB
MRWPLPGRRVQQRRRAPTWPGNEDAMNFSSLSIRNPLPAILLFFLLGVFGLFSFKAMPVQKSPDIDVPVVLVRTSLPGASPEQLESEVARRLENSLAAIPFVRHISTTINDGVVSISVEFRVGRDVGTALTEVRDAVDRIRRDLPAEMRDPVIGKVSDADVDAVLTYTVQSDRLGQAELSWLVDSAVSKALTRLPGVGHVTRVGGVDREVLVELDPVRMAALNVSAAVVSQQLERVQQEAPSGRASIGGGNQSMRTIGTVRSVADIAALELALPDGRHLRLDQVARVADAVSEPASIALLDGRRVVGFEVMRTPGASDITVAAAVRQAVAVIARSDNRVTFRETLNKVDAVKDNYAGSMALLYEGALLTVLVVWLFLRDWRATLISAIALPLSVVPTFLVIHLLGFTLNMVTLLSLALVIGLLVDDAIVEIENIMRHLRMGKSPLQAAHDAADEIGLAVVATSATLVAVFLPTAFLDDIVGQYFKQFGWTASVAVMASLLVARLLTPMMAAFLLKPAAPAMRCSPLMAPYLRAVMWTLAHRKTTVALSCAFFAGSLALIPYLQSAFVPPEDGTTTNVALELAPGSTLEDTSAVAEQARALLMQDADVTQVYAVIGDGAARRAALSVSLKPRTARHRKQVEIDAALRARLAALPAARVTVGDGDDDELMLMLASDDPAALHQAVSALQRDIRGIPGLGSIYSNVSLVRPELVVVPDFARAADLGVTVDAIGATLRVATEGDYDHALAKLNLPDRQLPIRVRLPASARADLSLLERLSVPGRSGNVPLSAVAAVRMDSAPAQIERRDRTRKVVIHVGLNGKESDAVLDDILDLPAMKNLPADVKRVKLGDAERKAELRGSFVQAILTGLLCVYLVLVLLFRGVMQPLTVMAALPLSFGGAFLALLVTGSPLSMPSLIGLLTLMGISGKNSILLVEYAIRVRRLGMSRTDALIEACRQRAQPVIMTTAAMGAGMLPIALGWGADPGFRAPLAIAVIGGLLTSTFLSLLVIPVVFTCVDDFSAWAVRKLRRQPPLPASESVPTPSHAPALRDEERLDLGAMQ